MISANAPGNQKEISPPANTWLYNTTDYTLKYQNRSRFSQHPKPIKSKPIKSKEKLHLQDRKLKAKTYIELKTNKEMKS